MKETLCIIVAVLLAGCASQGGMFPLGDFQMTEADTRFVPGDNVIYNSKNNRISTVSIAGGNYAMGSNGIFFNPVVELTPDGEVVNLAFAVANFTSAGTQYGSPNSLGVIQSASFLTEDEPIVLDVVSGDVDARGPAIYNSITRSASVSVTETGAIPLTVQQYRRIMAADELAAKIVGSERSVTYEADEIASAFQTNLRAFYKAHLR